MQVLAKGMFRARLSTEKTDAAAAVSLRNMVFRQSKSDGDAFDEKCQHLLIEDHRTATLLACLRIMVLPCGRDIMQSYSAQYYDLSKLATYRKPMLEIGRFCIAPKASNSDILRLCWGALAQIIETQKTGMLFGCTSFSGTNAQPYNNAFAMLHDTCLAPEKWQPMPKDCEAITFTLAPYSADKAQKEMPALLRSYLTMGAWVSDHAVVDHDLHTLHVFTGLEISAMSKTRKRLLRAMLV